MNFFKSGSFKCYKGKVNGGFIMELDIKMALPILLLQGVFSVYCILTMRKNEVKVLPKWLWGVLCLNTLGAVVFLIFGRKDD
ncbi:MAG: hypothetical protein E7214_06855 [Clostridium sp.]|nr:hypothetical protein [Clostridium sp.]